MAEDSGNKDRPIFIIKKGGAHGGHHGGAWKVAYADFVTAMMAFFLVMWLVTQSDIVKQAVQGYFQDPASYGKRVSVTVLKGGAGVIQDESGKKSPIEAPAPEELLRQQMQEVADHLREAIESMPGLDVLKNLVDIELTKEGLRIQLIEGSNDVLFFKAGSAVPTLKGELILKTIAGELGRITNELVIEGHTDGSDLARGEDYTNWELSSDRANTARRIMSESGLHPGQVYQVRGYANRKPRIRDDPSDPSNRRITILVLNRTIGHDPPDDQYDSPIIMSHKN